MDRLTTLDLFVRIGRLRRLVSRGHRSDQGDRAAAGHPTARALDPSRASDGGGRAYYRRCVDILADFEDAVRDAGGAVAGSLQVDVVGNLARVVLLPARPAFLARHPALSAHLSEDECFADLVRKASTAS